MFATATPGDHHDDSSAPALLDSLGPAYDLVRLRNRPPFHPSLSCPRACCVQYILQNGACTIQALDRRDDAPFNAISWPIGRDDSRGSWTATGAKTGRGGPAPRSSGRPAARSSATTSAPSRMAGSRTRALRSSTRSRARWAFPSRPGGGKTLPTRPVLTRPGAAPAADTGNPPASREAGRAHHRPSPSGRRSLRQNLPRPRPIPFGRRAGRGPRARPASRPTTSPPELPSR